MNHLDLFSGIGGFALGMPPVDRRFYSEIDDYACKVYQKRFPYAIPLGDIRNIDGERLKREYIGQWIITGGFPCQDISVAGKGEGLSGERSGLWFEMHRLIREIRPRIVVAENVSALTVRGLDAVLGSLAEIGYDAEWTCIRASDVGAPHRRERIWIVAYPHSEQPYWSRDERDRRPEFTDSNPVANPNGEQNNAKRGVVQFGRDTLGRNRETAQQKDRKTSDNSAGGLRENVSYADS